MLSLSRCKRGGATVWHEFPPLRLLWLVGLGRTLPTFPKKFNCVSLLLRLLLLLHPPRNPVPITLGTTFWRRASRSGNVLSLVERFCNSLLKNSLANCSPWSRSRRDVRFGMFSRHYPFLCSRMCFLSQLRLDCCIIAKDYFSLLDCRLLKFGSPIRSYVAI